MNDVEFTLTMIIMATLGMSIFIYMGDWLLYTIKKSDKLFAPRQNQPALVPIPRTPDTRCARRAYDMKTGIVCSLPIHQSGGLKYARGIR